MLKKQLPSSQGQHSKATDVPYSKNSQTRLTKDTKSIALSQAKAFTSESQNNDSDSPADF